MHNQPLVFVIMGVSGCGKSSVGSSLAHRLQCSFYDGDDFHPESNLRKMRSGIPLTDEDRWPWLQKLRELLEQHIAKSSPTVLACSALKPAYRQLLRGAGEGPQHQQPCCEGQHEAGGHQAPQTGLTAAQQQHPKCPLGGQGACQEVQQGLWPQQQQELVTGAGDMPQSDIQVAFVLLNPPWAVLQARLEARAASGSHFMPPSLLDSQLQQLEVPNPSELYMCFGSMPGSKHSHNHNGQAATAVGPALHVGMQADGDSSDTFPSTDTIVASILAHVDIGPDSSGCVDSPWT